MILHSGGGEKIWLLKKICIPENISMSRKTFSGYIFHGMKFRISVFLMMKLTPILSEESLSECKISSAQSFQGLRREILNSSQKWKKDKAYTMCFFFIELKVFVNLTYLYLSEINKQGIIFFVLLGHLIIRSGKWRKMI